MNLKEFVGILHLPIGIILGFISIEYLRDLIRPEFNIMIGLLSIYLIIIGVSVLFSISLSKSL